MNLEDTEADDFKGRKISRLKKFYDSPLAFNNFHLYTIRRFLR